jgi:hypothetical protein
MYEMEGPSNSSGVCGPIARPAAPAEHAGIT